MPDSPDGASHITCDPSGRLLVHTDKTATLFLPWPAMRAYRRSLPNGPWSGCQPEFAIPPETPVGADGGPLLQIVNDYCSRIPETVRRAVGSFPDRQWELLAWVARTGVPAEDLLTSNPALAYALAFADEFAPTRSPVARAATRYLLPTRKQTAALERLGFFPASERTRKILRKVQPRAVTLRRLRALRRWMADDDVADALARLPRIDHSVMALAERGRLRRTAFIDLLRMTRQEETAAADESVRIYADAVRVWRFDANAPAHLEPGSFPPPPVLGTDLIQPILTRAELVAEGHIQANCVAKYAHQVQKGRKYVYRVLHPQRCTASLTCLKGKWTIEQIEAKGNKPALPATHLAVRQWFDSRVVAIHRTRLRIVASSPTRR